MRPSPVPVLLEAGAIRTGVRCDACAAECALEVEVFARAETGRSRVGWAHLCLHCESMAGGEALPPFSP